MLFDQKFTSTLGFAGILCGSLLVALDAVALSPSLPIIEDALNSTTTETYWAGVSYTVGSAAFLPIFPAISSIVGRRPVSLVALALFFIGTIVCGTAQNIAALLSGRIIQGIGGGGIIGMMYAVIADLFSMNERPKAIALNGLVWLLGTSLGPIMGGGFSEDVSWRWIFWIVLPINGIALALVALFLEIPSPSASLSKARPQLQGSELADRTLQWKDLDYLGAVLLVGSLSSFLIAITWGGVDYAWSSVQTLVPLIIGVAGITAWVAYELLVPSNPLVPLRVFYDRTVGISLLHVFAMGVLQFAVVFYLPVYYQFVKGYSPLISGVALLPVTLLAGPFTAITGNLIAKTGKYKLLILVSWILMALGCGLYVLLKPSTSVVAWVFISVPVGIATGIVFAATAVSVQAPVKQEDAAMVSSQIGFFRSIGQAVGVACGNAITLNLVKAKLLNSSIPGLRQSADLIASNLSSPKVLFSFLGDAETMGELLTAYVAGLRGVWWLLFGVACFCGLSTFFIRDVGLQQDKSLDTRQLSDETLCAPSGAGSVSEKSGAALPRDDGSSAV